MVTFVLPRLMSFEGAPRRAMSVTERNVVALKSAYWLVVLSGFVEPVFYLLSIGVGVGALIGDMPVPNGPAVDYTVFVAPALLAASAMGGALTETTFNFFGKMKYVRLYDGILATPVRPFEIALGELCWAMARGGIYAIAFLLVMVLMDLTTAGRAVVAFPATALVGFAFGALGMALSTFLRSWQDFDLVASVQVILLLFSGTFVPAQSYPAVMRWVLEVTPLFRSVSLLRGISTATVGWVQLVDVLYLFGAATLGLVIASRRMAKLLCK